MSSGFLEIQFPPAIARGATGGPQFSTDIVILSGGFEKRNQNWQNARGKWNVATGIKQKSDMDAVDAFFRNVFGRAYGFRFKDWRDYQATATLINGQKGIATPATGDGSNKIFQLVKSYTFGSQTVSRPIKKPIAAGLVAYKNGVSATYTLDTTTGILTFTTAPGAGVVVTWDGQFDVPARFDTDSLDVAIEEIGAAGFLSNAANIPLTELRV